MMSVEGGSLGAVGLNRAACICGVSIEAKLGTPRYIARARWIGFAFGW
jgi:hypothetical protein